MKKNCSISENVMASNIAERSEVDMANDRERKCSVCGKVGHHDARNCPLKK